MASGTFEKTSLGWQIQQLSQRTGEWFEGLFNSNIPGSSVPTIPEIPEWFFRGLFWLIVLGAMIWTSWQIYTWLEPYWVNYWRSGQGGNRIVVQSPTAAPSLAEWLRQAHVTQQQGDYRTACRALYMATLQQLSERGLISQALSRTDGEYLHLVQTQNLPQPYQILIRTHERLCFDQVAASPEIYDRCWQAYQEIERT